jgi:hypothetical protein
MKTFVRIIQSFSKSSLSTTKDLNIPGDRQSPFLDSQWEACVTSSHQLHPACAFPAFLQYNVSLIKKVWPHAEVPDSLQKIGSQCISNSVGGTDNPRNASDISPVGMASAALFIK